jgi:hypothetical protein
VQTIDRVGWLDEAVVIVDDRSTLTQGRTGREEGARVPRKSPNRAGAVTAGPQRAGTRCPALLQTMVIASGCAVVGRQSALCIKTRLQVTPLMTDKTRVEHAALAGWERRFRRTGLGDEVEVFAGVVGAAPQAAGGLLVVGSAGREPWHFVAHLAEEAARRDRKNLAPTWVRWNPPPSAPGHLSVTVQRLEQATRRETVLVVDPECGDGALLERLADARRRGALVLAVHRADGEMVDVAHEALSVVAGMPSLCFEAVQHLVTQLAPIGPRRRRRARLERLLHFL